MRIALALALATICAVLGAACFVAATGSCNPALYGAACLCFAAATFTLA